MANHIWGVWKAGLLQNTADTDLDGSGSTGVYVALVDTGTYTFSSSHDFYNDLSGIVGTDQEIGATKSYTNGTFDGADVTFTAVSGNSVEALVIYRKNAGANTTWFLCVYFDTSVTGLPVTPNGGNISIAWNASGIFTVSDRRLKEDVRLVDHLNNVLPIYEYRYKGDKSGAVHRGVMAQDVERVAPDAVLDTGRIKMVNYDRVIERLAA